MSSFIFILNSSNNLFIKSSLAINFDFVVCTGVLHHLKNPKRGLGVIKDSQAKNSGAALMVYGKHGRIATYQIQHLMRLINEKEINMQRRVKKDCVIEISWTKLHRVQNLIEKTVASKIIILSWRFRIVASHRPSQKV